MNLFDKDTHMNMGTLNRNLQTMPSFLTMSVIARENMPAHDHALVAKDSANDGDLNKIGAIILVLESKLVKVKEKTGSASGEGDSDAPPSQH
jgi:hypothetical protein